jgi:hypothetical protein
MILLRSARGVLESWIYTQKNGNDPGKQDGSSRRHVGGAPARFFPLMK